MARLKGLDEVEPIVKWRRRRRPGIFDPDAVGPNGEVLHRRFGEAVRVRRARNPVPWPRLFAVFFGTVLAMIALQAWLDSFGFGSETVALRHLASGINCDVAYSLGLSPAKRGAPGYWHRLDRDGNGVSCERYDRAHPERYDRRPPGQWVIVLLP